MNKYIAGYDECFKLITATIVLASAYDVITKRGKELNYDPVTTKFNVIEYVLVPPTKLHLEEYTDTPVYETIEIYGDVSCASYVRDVYSIDPMYELLDAIEFYNQIGIGR